MKTVIMAGGRGSRISSISNVVPKPMIKINGKPVLEYEIECLAKYGLIDIIITVGYLGNVIQDYFGDGRKISPVTGKPFGVNIEYYFENNPLGNAGALFKIKEKLKEDFLLINADSIFNINFERFISFHKQKKAFATIFTHPNSHPFDSSIIVANSDRIVTKWFLKEDIRPKFYKNRVNAGIHILSPKVLDFEIIKEKIDLDREILKPLVEKGLLYCYDSPEYIKDMGTPDRYEKVKSDLLSGKIELKNLKHKQKAIFLDRDGTINKYVGFLKKIDDFELLPNVADFIKLVNESEYLVIVVTNQPVVARGEVSIAELEKIHDKMEYLLGLEGGFLDMIYYCPHHPEKGFPNEISELKINCNCRKPKPGMLIKASIEYNIDLEQSWMIGDNERDIRAGISAGCKTILIGKGKFNQTYTSRSLIDCKNYIFEN